MSEKGELETEFLNIIDLLRGKKTNKPVKKVVKNVGVGGKGEDDDEKNNDVKQETGSKIPRAPIKVDEPVDDPKVVVKPIKPEDPRKKPDINGFKDKLKGKLNEIIASESKRKAEEEEKKRKDEEQKRKDDEQKRLNEELARKKQELLDQQKRIATEQAEWNSRLTAIQKLIVSNSDNVDNALNEHGAKIDDILKKVDETADKTTLRTEIDNLERSLKQKVEELNDAEKQRHNGTVAEINNLKAMMKGNTRAQSTLYAGVESDILELSAKIGDLENDMNQKNFDTIKLLNDQVIRIGELEKQMEHANNDIEIISKSLNKQELEIERLKKVVDDKKNSEEQNKKELAKNINTVREKMQGELQHIQDEINAKLNSPDCCNKLEKQIAKMNAKIYKMQEEQNRIKLNGFKDKIKGFLEKIKGLNTGKSTASTASTGTDMGPDLGSEKLVSSI